MEKVTLIIKLNKKKKWYAQLVFEKTGKELPFPEYKPKDNTLDGTVVEVKREKGKPVEMKIGEEVIWIAGPSPTARPTSAARGKTKAGTGKSRPNDAGPIQTSTAPYNFVRLNETVVQAEGKPPAFNQFHPDLNNGYLTLNITTQTPLYIRDTMTPDDMKEEARVAEENKKKNTKFKYINPNFFSPGGKIRIPGSSLRGLIRTLVEIAGFAKLSFYEKNRKYHFRAFADKSIDLREDYSKKMKGDNEKASYSKELKAGYLIKEGLQYRVIPAKRINGRQFFRVEEDIAKEARIINERMSYERYTNHYDDNSNYKMDFKEIKFLESSIDKDIITKVFPGNTDVTGALKGKMVCSGWMRGSKKRNPRGKHKHWVVGPAEENAVLELEEGVMENYKNDGDRDSQANLLRYFNENPPRKMIPCFYIESKGKVISFGHTGFFRLAYSQKLSNLVPAQMNDTGLIDIAEAIFGKESDFPGRVFFEDAHLKAGQKDVLADETIIKILGKPSPTTFQHYLVQAANEIWPERQNYHGIKNYNTKGSRLRGNKLYWHKSNNPENWQENELAFHEEHFEKLLKENHLKKEDFGEALKLERRKFFVNLKKLQPKAKQAMLNAVGRYETQHTKVKYVNTGKSFSGRIRFENLTNVELGALLFALKLRDGCFHKMGMGKPLGLGSIQISCELHISQRLKRYTDLFAEWEQTVDNTANPTKLIKDFEQYVLKQLGRIDINSLWDTIRLKELNTMLDYKKGEELDVAGLTRYLELKRKSKKYPKGDNEFKYRNILPLPMEVK